MNELTNRKWIGNIYGGYDKEGRWTGVGEVSRGRSGEWEAEVVGLDGGVLEARQGWPESELRSWVEQFVQRGPGSGGGSSEPTPMNAFSKRVREERLRRGLGVARASRKIGIDPQTLRSVEQGNTPRWAVREKIERWLDQEVGSAPTASSNSSQLEARVLALESEIRELWKALALRNT